MLGLNERYILYRENATFLYTREGECVEDWSWRPDALFTRGATIRMTTTYIIAIYADGKESTRVEYTPIRSAAEAER